MKKFLVFACSILLVLGATVTVSATLTKGYWHISPIPEPVTMFLFGVALIGLASLGRKTLFK